MGLSSLMDVKAMNLKINSNMEDFGNNVEEEMDLRKGPWTVEEDFKLMNYITTHGEGRWNSLACCAGLKRTGKSCRLRWLNYLRPDVRRGNITLEEQLLILELHSRWGNRWSKIAQYLPGRTDNEIKNYWRTRVQKHAKQLRCDVNSQQFKDTMKYLWMPRLIERIQAASTSTSTTSCVTTSSDQLVINNNTKDMEHHQGLMRNPNDYITPDNSNVAVTPTSDLTDHQNLMSPLMSSRNCFDNGGLLNGDLTAMHECFENVNGMFPSYSDNFWKIDEDFWLLQQHHQLLDNGSF